MDSKKTIATCTDGNRTGEVFVSYDKDEEYQVRYDLFGKQVYLRKKDWMRITSLREGTIVFRLPGKTHSMSIEGKIGVSRIKEAKRV